MTFVQMIWPATRAIAKVPEQAVKGHRGIGWVPLSEWAEPAPTQTPAADEPASAKTSRRRGADTQE